MLVVIGYAFILLIDRVLIDSHTVEHSADEKDESSAVAQTQSSSQQIVEETKDAFDSQDLAHPKRTPELKR